MSSSQVNVKKGAEQAPYMASTSATTESVFEVRDIYQNDLIDKTDGLKLTHTVYKWGVWG